MNIYVKLRSTGEVKEVMNINLHYQGFYYAILKGHYINDVILGREGDLCDKDGHVLVPEVQKEKPKKKVEPILVKMRSTGKICEVLVLPGGTCYLHPDLCSTENLWRAQLGVDCDQCDNFGNLLFPVFKQKKPKFVAEIDDTTAFGMRDHNHNKHRVFVKNLSHKQAQMLCTVMNSLLEIYNNDGSL